MYCKVDTSKSFSWFHLNPDHDKFNNSEGTTQPSLTRVFTWKSSNILYAALTWHSVLKYSSRMMSTSCWDTPCNSFQGCTIHWIVCLGEAQLTNITRGLVLCSYYTTTPVTYNQSTMLSPFPKTSLGVYHLWFMIACNHSKGVSTLSCLSSCGMARAWHYSTTYLVLALLCPCLTTIL